MNEMILQESKVFVGYAWKNFDSQGHCCDEVTIKFLTDQIVAFKKWIVEASRMHAPV